MHYVILILNLIAAAGIGVNAICEIKARHWHLTLPRDEARQLQRCSSEMVDDRTAHCCQRLIDEHIDLIDPKRSAILKGCAQCEDQLLHVISCLEFET